MTSPKKDDQAAPLEGMDWLEGVRGLSVETAARHGVTAGRGKSGAPLVKFPYHNRAGDLLGHKIRATGDKRFFFHPSGRDRNLFNAACLYDDELQGLPIYITEGEIDALSVIEAGKMRAVSMPDGWTEGLTNSDTPKLKPIFDNLSAFEGQDVIIAGDDDKPGRSMARAIFGALEETAKSIRSVVWPEGCKDANDVLLQHGRNALLAALESAKHMAPLGLTVSGVHDLPPMPDRTIYAPLDPAFDDIFRLELGTVNVITGIPNHGKSTAAVAILHALACNNRIRVGAVMFETHPAQLRNQIHRLECGRPFDINDPRSVDVARRASRHWAIVHPQEDDDVPFDMKWVKDTIRTLALHHDCKVVMIDPWNELEHDIQRNETETQYIKTALAHLRKWAKRYDVAVVIIAHPKKMDGTEPPGGYDISGSSTWYDKAYLGLTVFLNRDEENGTEHTDLIAWKVKDREAYGIAPSTTRVAYQHNTGGFKLLTDHNYDRAMENTL